MIAILLFLAVLLAVVQAVDTLVRTVLSWTLETTAVSSGTSDPESTDSRNVLIVVPVIITGERSVEAAVRCLARNVGSVGPIPAAMAVLMDLFDSETEQHSRDVELVTNARSRIAEFERHYPGEVFLIHRDRVWNEKDQMWMGWERKRGKLQQLNELILGLGQSSMRCLVGAREELQKFQYVITLDVDSTLDTGAAPRLVNALRGVQKNREVPDRRERTISVLQPLPVSAEPLEGASTFERIWYGPVDRATQKFTKNGFDLYQHFFNEGSYYGKGIYDVKDFQQALDGAIPTDLVLSHDILEGSIAGAKMCCDIKVFEPGPATYRSEMRRRHRWIRGDWQLIPWILGVAPSRYGQLKMAKLSGLAKWKLIDNLRRSLSPIAFLMLYAWIILHDSSRVAWLAVVAMHLISEILSATRLLLGYLIDRRRSPNYLAQDLWLIAMKSFLLISLLPVEGKNACDAIVRALWRLAISGRKMLEWQTSSDAVEVEETSSKDVAWLWPGPLLALSLGISLAIGSLQTSLPAIAFIVVWALSPALLFLSEKRRLTLTEIKPGV